MGLLIVLTGLWLYSSVKADSKAITTSLTTKWFSYPLLLEASEFLAEDSQEKFWNFVEASQNIGSSDHHGTNNYSYYHAILEAAFQFLSPLQQNLLKFCLSLRSYSATIQAFQQIAADEPPPEGCNSFFSVHGEKTCDFDDLETLLLTASGRPKPLLFKGDHRYPSSNPESTVVIFYSEIGLQEFSSFHHQLVSKSNAGKINYVFRHYISNPRKEPVHLSGYGVELAIKSTEYKAKDDTQVKGIEVNTTVIGENDPIDEVQGFLFGRLRDLHPELTGQLKELRKHLVESTNEMAPLKVWQLQDLSFQTAARILAAPAELALVVMKDLSQNFPAKASLFDVLRNEARVMEGLHRLRIEGLSLHNILKLNIQPSEAEYAIDIRSPAISWVNNLEVDSRYNSWPSSLQELLRPTFPGVIRQIRKNLHNMVFIVDPAHENTAELINTAEMFLSNHIPLRIGFIFVVNDSEDVDGMQDAGVAVLRAYNYVVQDMDEYHAFQTLTRVYNKVKTGDKVKVEHVVSVLEKKYPYLEVNSILGIDSAYDQNRKEARGYYEQTGIGPLPVVLFNGMPFAKEQLDPDELETITMHKILETTTFFQRAVYLGELSHDQDVVEYIMNQPNVVPRINSRVLTAEREYLDLTASNNFFVDDYTRFSVLDSQGKTAAIANSMNYLTKKGMSSKEVYDDSFIRPVTFWIVGDFDSASGRQLLYDAIKHQKSSNNVRISMINNPSKEISYKHTQISRAIWAALQTQTSNSAKNFITKMVKEDTAEALVAGVDIGEFSVGGMDFSLFKEVFESSKMDFILSHAVYCRDVLKLKKGQRAVISNGRIIGPLEDNELFNQDDFHLLENIVLKTSGQKIKSHIQQLRVEEDVFILDAAYSPEAIPSFPDLSFVLLVIQLHEPLASDLVMKVDALLSVQPKGDARIEYQFFEDKHSAIKLRPKEGETYFDVVAVVDPVTREAQRLAPLLLVLTQLINMNLRVFMNCQSKLSDMPLKSFYRYVLEPEISFTSDNNFAKGPIAKFLDMPQSPLFTLNLNTPESWMVESVKTPYDLDNIYLVEVDSVVAAEYELEYLLLEGHCYDITTGQPPRGLQFTLGTSANPVIVDTIVMANLGYFQLKANPGAWILRLRKGRSEDIYRIYSHDGTDSPPDADEVLVILNNFKSKIIKVKVQKKADMVNEDLLSDGTNENESGFWDSFKWGFSGGQKTEEVKQDKDDIINIFSVASGHLYERFLRIMMLSVLKNTKTPVKFWFLKNYLSPTFKEFIPYMANEYNFHYELVQYKWPRWLHQQTEKQRIIWGYKILFLDVLFPLAVDKFLFVDADQIVRTDLKELRDFNLDGAPYGYTPFCDSRREMDGYRFWKSGYWASHLAGRKYHISALYIVDLKKFRKIAAGDRLRGQYQGLSQDPNSLSNLDQDLPNNMIHQVPIKSLPQEWLWCETWCDDTSKKRAKTIDLCNNPMTKEPKLEAAVRIVPEWQDYDLEIKQLQIRFQKEKEMGTLFEKKIKEPTQEVLEDRGPPLTAGFLARGAKVGEWQHPLSFLGRSAAVAVSKEARFRCSGTLGSVGSVVPKILAAAKELAPGCGHYL
ncbi:UDP-glucose:glycoprotein glucosyltransferase 1 [Heterocephalus glaber]|uniref:UDP-glucose:glycoprotein glucosyltransferase 1 n=1 Tax=Heterocephalus glaber TaxID=10181 RepID=G5C327_HETGA|nr:UDP-glucose:glycoprotein glucosyltransferase 1 [Heterocephalus glaber]